MVVTTNGNLQFVESAIPLLQVFCKDITAEGLIKALQNYCPDSKPKEELESFLTVAKAAKVLDVSKSTVFRYLKAGILEKVTIPNTSFVRVLRSSISNLTGEK